MAKSRRRKLEFDVRPWVESLGLEELVRQIGQDELLDELLKNAKPRDIIANLPRAKREELKRLLATSVEENR
jgi:hypothetical protein